MILSKSSLYAVRATLLLAEEGKDRPMPVEVIAGRLQVPRNYLSKILHELARGDLLESTRGPGGGFRLGRSADRMCLADVVRHFDQVPHHTSCLLGRQSCSDADPCAAHERWAEVRDRLVDFLEETRLTDLSTRGDGGLSSGPPGPSDPQDLS